MTAERDLDFRLASWLDERATTGVPEDLLERSLARVERVTQRPSLLTRDAYALPWLGTGRAPLAAPLLLLLAVVLAVVLVVVGSQLVLPRLTVVVPPPRTSEPQRTLGPTEAPPTDTPAPADTRPPALPAETSMFAAMYGIAPFGDSIAWVSTEAAIYRTEDAGLTWRTVQPVGYSKAWVALFVDADTAYVNIGDGTTIASTHDGGASWTTTVFDAGDGYAPTITFRDALTGAVTFVDRARENSSKGLGLIVFSTTDGGATWTGPVRGTQPRIPDALNKIEPPIDNVLVDSSGKRPGTTYNNDFYLSVDGGISWQKHTFPINSISRPNNLKNVDQVFVEPNGRLLVELSASPDGPGGHPNGIYESTDDPAAWTLLYTETETDSVQFLSATTWIAHFNPANRIRITLDAGATWADLTSTTQLYYAAGPTFGSLRTSWFTVECRPPPYEPQCSHSDRTTGLFVTTDGGATWSEVGG